MGLLFKDEKLTLVYLDRRTETGKSVLQQAYYIKQNNRWYQWTGSGVRRIHWAEQIRALEEVQ
ncbi:MAG: hypothetical protein ACWGQW_05755 [bacterium]